MRKKIIKEATASVWGASPAGTAYAGGAEPGTREFFEKALAKRSDYEIPWLFELVPFASFKDKKVLELGCGAGFDAYEMCRNGAVYTGIDITPENPVRTRKHLSYYDFKPDVSVGDAESLQFHNDIFDIVFSNGVLHHTPDMQKSFIEAFRVLKKGGVFYVILYNKNSIFHWVTLWLVDHVLNLGFTKRTFKERLSMIEYTTSKELPLVNVYSRKDVANLLEKSGFKIDESWVRKLLVEDLPHIPYINTIWKCLPDKLIDFLANRWGWYIIVKASKR